MSTVDATDAHPGVRTHPLPVRTIALGTIGSLLILVSALGAGAILAQDPLLGRGPMSWIRYGHGRMLATLVLYIGFALVVWAWVRLGRHVLAGRVGSRPVLAAAACWIVPMLFSPPVFSRDAYLYIAYGTLPLHGFDPYTVGPGQPRRRPGGGQRRLVLAEHAGAVRAAVHPAGQGRHLDHRHEHDRRRDPHAARPRDRRRRCCCGRCPALVRHLGGRLPVALWLAIAGPMTVVHLVGGPHNDLLMVGFLAVGTALMLDRRHVLGMVRADARGRGEGDRGGRAAVPRVGVGRPPGLDALAQLRRGRARARSGSSSSRSPPRRSCPAWTSAGSPRSTRRPRSSTGCPCRPASARSSTAWSACSSTRRRSTSSTRCASSAAS